MTSPLTPARIIPLGEDALLAEFAPAPDLPARLRAVGERLLESDAYWTDATPAETSLAMAFDPYAIPAEDAGISLRDAFAAPPPTDATIAEALEIPACYDAEFAPDLADLAARTGLSPDAVIELHTGAAYDAIMLGFTPGFAYLGPLDARLAAPRLDRPRTHTPVGAIAVAGRRTGVYALGGPGGWRVIGRTPMRLFDPALDPPFILRAGMKVRFRPIAAAEFRRLAGDDA